MVHGSWFMVHGSWFRLMAHGSWLMAHGSWKERGPGPGPELPAPQSFLGHEPWTMSHENHEPLIYQLVAHLSRIMVSKTIPMRSVSKS